MSCGCGRGRQRRRSGRRAHSARTLIVRARSREETGLQDQGAVEENASRRRFLLAAPVAAGAAFLAACGSSSDPQTAEDKSSDASAPKGGQDLVIVNYALTLEHIEADFYDKVVAAGIFSGATGDLFKLIQENEHQHVDALTALAKKLGGRPSEAPVTNFRIGGARGAPNPAPPLEHTGVAAYLGQGAQIKTREVLAAALSITRSRRVMPRS